MKADVTLAAICRTLRVVASRWRGSGARHLHELATGAIFKFLSQLAWMDEVWLEKDVVVSRLADKGKDFTESDKPLSKPSNWNCSARFCPRIATLPRAAKSS